MASVRLLLFPFAFLYRAITSVRNRLYDQGYKPVATFDLVTIGVGNLAVGGTGKTPMVEHLIRLYQREQVKVATLSRGYGRRSKGFKIAAHADNAETIGDEPYQFYRKFGNAVPVAVGEDRAMAISYLVNDFPETEVVLLDDAFQHRRVKPTFQVLLTDYNRLFYKDFLLPAGNLRESRAGAQRADVIVVTKCPVELSDDEMIAIEKEIRRYSHAPVFFSYIRYGDAVFFGGAKNFVSDSVVLVTGIANATPMLEYARKNFDVVKHFELRDHHQYDEQDIAKIAHEAGAKNATVITTEKDFVKLDAAQFRSVVSNLPIAYFPIEAGILKNGQDFDEMLVSLVKKSKKLD